MHLLHISGCRFFGGVAVASGWFEGGSSSSMYKLRDFSGKGSHAHSWSVQP